MKMILLSFLAVFSCSALSVEMEINRQIYNDKETKEGVFHTSGQYIDQKGNIVSESKVMRSSIYKDNKKYTNTQYALIPATTEVRNIIKESRRIENVEGSVLETKVTDNGHVKFSLIKILVRSVR